MLMRRFAKPCISDQCSVFTELQAGDEVMRVGVVDVVLAEIQALEGGVNGVDDAIMGNYEDRPICRLGRYFGQEA